MRDMSGPRGWLQHGREGPSGGPEIMGSAGRGEQTRPGTGCWTKAKPGGLVRVLARKPSYLARLWEGCTFFFPSVLYQKF